jgi:peptidoglycan/LPS O-acetylase OafA/YrhL
MRADFERARRGAHVPSLDGVRGLAILLVLLYHSVLYGGMRPEVLLDRAVYRVASGGWLGVDLFFVLSGFLITGILLDSRRSPTYFRTFYSRRVLRIFPLYFVFLAVFLWILPLLREMGPKFEVLRQNQVWCWTYLTNVRIAMEGWAPFWVLGHFWSLAVEEQFYLVWPFVVFAFRPRVLVRICLVCLVIPLILRIGLALQDHFTAAYVVTFTRMDALAAGALLATQIRRQQNGEGLFRYRKVTLVASLVILGAMFAHQRSLWPESLLVTTLGLSVITLGAASLMATLLYEGGSRRLSRLFENRSLRLLGKYSYGIYVLHHPLVIFLGQSRLAASEWPTLFGSQMPGQVAMILLGSALSIAAALLSWKLLESPLLELKRYFPYAPAPSARQERAQVATRPAASASAAAPGKD